MDPDDEGKLRLGLFRRQIEVERAGVAATGHVLHIPEHFGIRRQSLRPSAATRQREEHEEQNEVGLHEIVTVADLHWDGRCDPIG